MCSEVSPRISFSHDDLGQIKERVSIDDGNESRRDTTLLDSTCESDFEFSIISSSFEQEYSSADELFANGVILPVPVQIHQESSKVKVQRCAPPPTFSLPPLPRNENSKKDFNSTKEVMLVNNDNNFEDKGQSNYFWGSFRRSSSLNCDAKKSLICSLPLLSRSSSTGSVPNKRTSKDFQKPGSQKLQTSSTSSHPYHQSQQKLSLKKNYGNVNAVKISPVLNVPPPYISKGSAALFGFGSFLRSSGSKDKRNKK